MKKIILSIFITIISVTLYVLYPFLPAMGMLSIGALEQIIFPNRDIVISGNHIDFTEKICIPYKSYRGQYSIAVKGEDENIEPFSFGKDLLNHFDFDISIYNNKNELLFHDTPEKIKSSFIERYYLVVLNRYVLPKAGCYTINVIGIKKTPNEYGKLYFNIYITHQFG
ncbi:MAG: hypothetical protein Q4A60_07115 [Pasteurellaceae bacterium]|nr:hypothetical protein [Pasteurellaceae bacterium]